MKNTTTFACPVDAAQSLARRLANTASNDMEYAMRVGISSRDAKHVSNVLRTAEENFKAAKRAIRAYQKMQMAKERARQQAKGR